MFYPTQKLKDNVADALVNVLIKARREPEEGLKMEGRFVTPTEVPRFLQVAALLHEYICTAGDRWRTEDRVVKLVERSIRDLDLEVEATLEDPNPEPDVGEYVDYIRKIRAEMNAWMEPSESNSPGEK